MKLITVNRFFKKFAVFQIKFRWLLLGGLILLTAAGILGLGKIKPADSMTGWFDDKDEIEIQRQEFEERFGNNDRVGILVEADNIFDYEVLTMIRALGEDLLNNVPYAEKVSSITEVQISLGTEDGMAVINPIGDVIPEDPQKLEEIRDLCLSRSSLADKLVSSDCKETWISLSLREYPEEGDPEYKDIEPLYEVGEAAIAIVNDSKWNSEKYSLKGAGLPYSETEEKEFMGKEIAYRASMGFIIMVILLAVFIRSFRGVIIPSFTTIAGIIVVLGFMGWFNIDVDTSLVMLPIILGMALSVGYSIHLVNSFKRLYLSGKPRRDAVTGAVEKTGWPILFTVFTTMGSMVSFSFIGISPIRWLGLSCAAVVLVVFLYVIILVPILFSFGKDRPSKEKSIEVRHFRTDGVFLGISGFVQKNRKLMLVLFIVLAIVSVPGIMRINVNIDSFEFMGVKLPYMKRLYDIVNSRLGSYVTYNITISFDEPDRVKDPEVLNNFEKLLERAGEFELTKRSPSGVPKIFSILDILKDMNQTLNEDKAEFYSIPESRDLIAQLLFLYELSGGNELYQWVDDEFSMLRAQIELYQFETNEISYELQELQSMAEELFPGGEIRFVGDAVQFAEMNDMVVFAEIKSFLIALVIIAILLSIVFSSIKTGLIGLIPNIAPVLVIGGIMGYFGFSLDLITMIVMPMLLGIAVDDTIHFINQIKYEFEMTGNYRQAINNAFTSIGLTLTMTTVILSFGFGVFTTSLISAFRNVGFLAPLGLLTALIADYLMTPALMIITHPFGKEKR